MNTTKLKYHLPVILFFIGLFAFGSAILYIADNHTSNREYINEYRESLKTNPLYN